MKKTWIITGEAARAAICRAVMSAPVGFAATVGEATRTLDQNAALWPILEKLSTDLIWYGQKLTAEEWKDVLSASLKRQKVVPGIDGGFVVCGSRTSKMGKKEFSDLLELAHAFAAQQGVVIDYREAA